MIEVILLPLLTAVVLAVLDLEPDEIPDLLWNITRIATALLLLCLVFRGAAT